MYFYVLWINPEAIYLHQGVSLANDFDIAVLIFAQKHNNKATHLGLASPNLAMPQLQPSDNQQFVISPQKSVKVRTKANNIS
ncbi:hypothetical protein C7N43_08910 [Sphingobacteriales bacterium UPWRP_1]|nr:hypothetical protein BVG80_11015 [Sphingobacteriales bacterium TSM_CSM]PSJ77447.1 hypothetical protein C7N43_08910 [Sphingobacteriales bacterium UPWRP_1]